MTLTASGGLVWGLPVRPDLLGEALEAYQKVLPKLTALRLCHRFGKVPDVHVTKLPLELLQSIEGIIFERKLENWEPFSWKEAFEHFEGRCQPSDHVYDDRWMDLKDDAFDGLGDEMCEKCQEKGFSLCDCGKDCDFKVQGRMNEIVCESGRWHFQQCDEAGWEVMISADNFAPYQKILHEHFGLEALFATTQIDERNKDFWPKHENHKWLDDCRLRTTICYLIIPQSMAIDGKYIMCDDMHEMADVNGVESCIVELPTPQDKERRAARFKRALRALHLKPFVHPSQLKTKTSATSSAKDAPQASSNVDEKKSEDNNTEGVDNSEWPQLIMVVRAGFHWD